MKVINRLGRKNLYFGSAILTLLALSITSVFAGVITVSGNCTGTTNISRTNYTFTGTCTGTISTSETTATNQELIGHAFNPDCGPIDIPTSVTYFQSNFSSINKTWAIYTQVHDKMHNYTLVAGFTTFHGNHTFTETFTTPNMTMTATIPIVAGNGASTFGQQRSLNSNVIAGDNIDAYANPNAVQMIWYINNTQGIENELNLPPYPVNNFIPSDIAVYFTGQINGLNAMEQVGNQFQTPQSPLEVPMTSGYDSPCGISPVILSNVVNEFPVNNSINNGTMIVEEAISP